MPSNNLTSNLQTKTIRSFLKEFDSDIVSLNTVDKSVIPSGAINPETGDTVYVKRPHKFNVFNTATGDISAETKGAILSGRAKATVQDHGTIVLDWEALEEAVELDQLDKITSYARSELITDVEKRLNTFMKNNGAHQLGTAGTSISKWSDVSNIEAYMNALGTPMGTIYGQVGPYAIRNLADSIKGIYSSSDAMTAWERAQIPQMAGGIKLFKSNTLAAHTVGNWDAGLQLNAAPTQTYVAGKDTFQTTIVIKGCDVSTTDFVTAGDKITISGKYFTNFKTRDQASGEGGAGLVYTGTVNANADSDGSGLCTVVLNGPAFYEASGQYNTISAALATDDVVNVVSGTAATAYVPNLFYHEQAFGCLSVAQKRLHSLDTKFANGNGMQIRFTDYSSGDKNENYMRVDVLPAFACYNPLLAGTFYGE